MTCDRPACCLCWGPAQREYYNSLPVMVRAQRDVRSLLREGTGIGVSFRPPSRRSVREVARGGDQ